VLVVYASFKNVIIFPLLLQEDIFQVWWMPWSVAKQETSLSGQTVSTAKLKHTMANVLRIPFRENLLRDPSLSV
jgi:hypothetical protein